MRRIKTQNALRRATICFAFTLFCLNAMGQELIDLSKTPFLCNQFQLFKLKEVLPDGYVFDYKSDISSNIDGITEIVFTRDNETPNRYTSKFTQMPYMTSCDYEVKKIGNTVTLLAYLSHYQEDNPYYVVFAADSQKEYCKRWQKRVKDGIRDCDWLFNVPIDDSFIDAMDIDQLKQMLSMLEQSKNQDDLIKFNINKLNIAIASMEGDCDCEEG